MSTLCPTFVLNGRPYGGADPIKEERGETDSEGPVRLTFAPMKLEGGGQLEVILHLQWSKDENLLRKWARYRLTGSPQSVLVEEVVLDELDEAEGAVAIADQATISPPASYPVLLKNFFVGIEFPVASTRIDNARVIVAHHPGLRLQPDTWYETRRAVYGGADAGQEKERFRRYIQAHTPGGFQRMFVWETWISVPLRYTETDQAEVLKIIHDNLLTRHNVTVDACVLTAGWSNPESIYQLDRARFPGGFDGIQAACVQNGLAPGFWISPCAFYGFALDTKWAKDQGYETLALNENLRVACIGGKRYQSEFKKRVVEMFEKHGMTYAYFDGFASTCSETDHGHELGALSAEILAENLIDVFQACRAVQPSAWLEATCFGGNASPWWLFHVNTVLGNYGDDCMFGRVPAPVYRESQTTGRDRANLQGCVYSILPVAQQEVFAGLYCHTTEPLVNDAVMGVLRGNMLYLLCTNPRLVSDYGWSALARVIGWARTNTKTLAQTEPLLPASWDSGMCPKYVYEGPTPREAYGYAHWAADEGIVAIRNPWIVPTLYTLELGRSTGFSPDTTGLCAISVYPENRTYATGLRYGDEIRVPLRPYETLVLWIRKPLADVELPNAPGDVAGAISATPNRADVSRLMFDSVRAANSENCVCLTGDVTSAIQLDLDSDITVDAPKGEVLILLEDKEPIISPNCTVSVNGEEVRYTFSGPDTGYNADSHPCPEHWLFLRAPLFPGRNHVQVQLTTRAPSPRLSVWAWAKKDGTVDGSTYPNSLPQPEEISLGAVAILSPVDGASTSLKTVKAERPVMEIDGIFIDALEPDTVTGTLVKNTNAGRTLMKVFGRTLLRGLGTNAPSRISFVTAGHYGRFQSWVGVDSGAHYADKSRIVFEIWADGDKLWNSVPMTRWDSPVFVDVDISGHDRIELVTLDQADKGAVDRANWADWGEARVLK
ncbi:MAG: NPCBM/NEW2 domain-containing protein [Pirellulaceae bacterium]